MTTHSDNIDDNYIGYAPYNFITLNEKVITIDEELPDRSHWHNDRLTGVINCSLCTESPLYIGGSDTDQAAFFHWGDPEQPVIPGSSLRGMLRTLVEIISFSKLQPITDKKLFYRDIRDRDNYQTLFVKKVGNKSGGNLPNGTPVFGAVVKAGIFHANPQSGYWLEPCEVGRVDHNILARDLGTHPNGPFVKSGNRWFPDPAHQGEAVTVNVDPADDHPFPAQPPRHKDQYLRFRKVRAISNEPSRALAQAGILVLTGSMKHKHMEFVFLPSGAKHPKANRLDEIIERFESDDQITEWQEKAFPKNQPAGSNRRRNGALRDGEPVFYLEDNKGEVDFIGRAQLFRLPFGYPPSDLRYAAHKEQASLDFAEALFGFVDKPVAGEKNKKWTAAGRVYISDATLTDESNESIWLDPEQPVFHTHVLATPKPSAYAHYLVQDNPNTGDRSQLSNHRRQNAIIRGHKFYWHQTKGDGGNAAPLGAAELRVEPNPNNPAQYPQVKPIRPGVGFAFRVNFDHLTEAELGALLWAITLPGPATSKFRHKVGMGKPLGMGSVRLHVDSLRILDPETRLCMLFAQRAEGENGSGSDLWRWETGLNEADRDSYVEAFKSWLEGQLGLPAGGFDRHDRIRALRMMLRWPGLRGYRPPYMDFQDHMRKLVLPNPERVYAIDRMSLEPRSACIESEIATGDVATTVDTQFVPPLPAGTEVRMMVIDVDEKGVYLEPVNLPEAYEDYVGFIPAVNLAGKKYNVNLPARVIVVEVDEVKQQILCRPRT